jgi:hypothetical protein
MMDAVAVVGAVSGIGGGGGGGGGVAIAVRHHASICLHFKICFKTMGSYVFES